MELKLDYIKLEEKLEVAINSVEPLEIKIIKIKKLLNKMVISEATLTKFVGLTIQETNTEAGEQKTKENGQI